MVNSSMGLSIGISPEMARKLRQQSIEPPEEESSSTLSALQEIPPKQALDSSANISNDTDNDLPYISIHVERLIGYQPRDSEELEAIKSQLVEAMWTSYQQTLSDGQPISASERLSQPPPDFDRQVMEFFESGVARYVESSSSSSSSSSSIRSQDETDRSLSIRYPAYLQSPITGERISTLKIVSEIQHKEPDLEFLSKLWKYLRECSMTLFWKRDMATELAILVREEQARLEYQEWTESKRQLKLDNLYSIRETLVHQVEMAKSKVEVMEGERDVHVEETMEPFRRKLQQGKHDSLDAFGTTDLSFPDEFQWLGVRDEPLVDGEDDWGLDSDNDDGGDDNYSDGTGSYDSVASDDLADESSANDDTQVKNDASPVEDIESHDVPVLPIVNPMESAILDNKAEQDSAQVLSAEEKVETELELSIPFQRRKDRREKSKRRKRQELKAAEQKARQEQLHKLEEELRSKLTSKELILAQTIHNALAEKMTKIEELLDSLQDEVWQAEEELDQQSKSSKTDLPPESEFAFSLLDQVLAMIFGATPIKDGKSPEEHYRFLQNEHNVIVAAWQAHFGRLPPPTVRVGSSDSGPSMQEAQKEAVLTSKEHRKELGIADNDEDDWEAVENWDDLLDDKNSLATRNNSLLSKPQAVKDSARQSKHETSKNAKSEAPPAPKLVGLRPGGRVIRPSHD